MSILSMQNMRKCQQYYMKMGLPEKLTLKQPNNATFCSDKECKWALLSPCSPACQGRIGRIFRKTSNLCSIMRGGNNAALSMLTYCLLHIIVHNAHKQSSNEYLLDSIKCSFYSPDTQFSSENRGVDGVHLKAYMARFFSLLQSAKMQRYPMRYLQCILEGNPLVLEVFVLYFHAILKQLDTEITDKQKDINACLALLIEYFDINCRIFSNLYMFHEQSVFMTFTNDEIAFGEYQQEGEEEGERDKEKDKDKVNQVNTNKHLQQEKRQEHGSNQCGNVDQADMKLFNFMFDSDSNPLNTSRSLPTDRQEREHQNETPHFQDVGQQFNFGKKKSQIFKLDQARNEFERLINDESMDEAQEDNEEYYDAPTPVLGGYADMAIKQNKQSFAYNSTNIVDQKSDLDQMKELAFKILDSPVDFIEGAGGAFQKVQAGNILAFPKKDRMSIEEKKLSEQRLLTQKQKGLNAQQNSEYFHQSLNLNHQLISKSKALFGFGKQINESQQTDNLCSAQCRQTKNTLASRIISVSYIPPKIQKPKQLTRPPAPSFLTSTSSSFIKGTPLHKQPQKTSFNHYYQLTKQQSNLFPPQQTLRSRNVSISNQQYTKNATTTHQREDSDFKRYSNIVSPSSNFTYGNATRQRPVPPAFLKEKLQQMNNNLVKSQHQSNIHKKQEQVARNAPRHYNPQQFKAPTTISLINKQQSLPFHMLHQNKSEKTLFQRPHLK